jgi:hypothetical protein
VSEGAQQEEDMDSTRSATADAIATAFGGRWGIWLSGTGRWWAARQGGPSVAGQGGADVLLVRADDPDQLRVRIQEQEARPGRGGVDAGWPAGRRV